MSSETVYAALPPQLPDSSFLSHLAPDSSIFWHQSTAEQTHHWPTFMERVSCMHRCIVLRCCRHEQMQVWHLARRSHPVCMWFIHVTWARSSALWKIKWAFLSQCARNNYLMNMLKRLAAQSQILPFGILYIPRILLICKNRDEIYLHLRHTANILSMLAGLNLMQIQTGE